MARSPISFGRPRPVVCDEEAAWFDNGSQDQSDRAVDYIRTRFASLLPSDDVETLASNPAMLRIVTAHSEVFDDNLPMRRAA